MLAIRAILKKRFGQQMPSSGEPEQTPEYLRFNRLEQSKALLMSGMQVSRVVDEVGFSSLSYFGACFKAEFGQSPKQFQVECEGKVSV
jgi:AraC-like DNA-binding protein